LIDDEAPGWRSLEKGDFTRVNSSDDTWTWKADGLHCTGQPVSVIRTVNIFTNFEMVVEWSHQKFGGNSGVFLWATPESIQNLTGTKPGLPKGIEVQILDHGYTQMMKDRGQKTDWFGTNGDVFAVGVKMKPFPPLSPDGSRSFPRKHLAKGHGEWNHYYIRAINGEVRLWVNGEEVFRRHGLRSGARLPLSGERRIADHLPQNSAFANCRQGWPGHDAAGQRQSGRHIRGFGPTRFLSDKRQLINALKSFCPPHG